VVADGSNVVDEPQLVRGESPRVRSRVDVQAGEGEDAGALPLFDGSFDVRGPHEVRLVRGASSVIGHGEVIVRAALLVLGTVAALRKGLVASDMAFFTSLTSFAGFGMAPSGRATTGTSHCKGCRKMA